MNPLIKSLVTEAWVPDEEAIQHVLSILKNRFVDERVQGFTHPETGEHLPPVAREEAEARWTRVAPQFLDHLRAYNPDMAQRFGTHRWVDDDAPAAGVPADAGGVPADVAAPNPPPPPQHARESLVSQTVKKLIT